MSYGPKPKKVAYVVIRGRIPGIYESWEEAHPQVQHFQGACFKGYFTYEAAVEVWEKWEEDGVNLIQQKTHTRAGRTTKKGKAESRDRIPHLKAYAERIVREYSGPNGKGEHTYIAP